MIRRIAEMGEVVVDVNLSNMYDVQQARQDQIPGTEIRSCFRRAVVDTGAVMSVVPRQVVEELGLDIVRESNVRLADGNVQHVGVVYGVLFGVMGRETPEEAFVLGNEVLIGQTVLEKLDLLVDCANQTLIGRHPDGPLHRV